VYFGRENLENVLKVSAVPIEYESGGPQSNSGCFGEERKLLCLLGIETCFLVPQSFA
jgi:hypothetical protein